MSSKDWEAIIFSQMWNVPYALIYSAGIVLALAWWRRHPMVSLLSFVAFAMLLLSVGFFSAVQIWQLKSIGDGRSPRDFSRLMNAVMIVRVLSSSIALILLLFSIFGWRDPATPKRSGW